MALIRSTLFALLFYVGSVPIVLTAALLALVSRKGIIRVARLWAGYFWFLARHILGIEVVVKGEVPQKGVIVAAKHQSAFETIAALHIFRSPAVVLKAELTRIPFWGLAARRHGAIPVDRAGSGRALRRMMHAAEAALAEGRPILIFPEGTRTAIGEAPPLKPGFAGLYRHLKVPVVPVALDSGAVWPRRAFVKKPGRITLVFGPPIPPGLDRKTIEARVHDAINQPVA